MRDRQRDHGEPEPLTQADHVVVTTAPEQTRALGAALAPLLRGGDVVALSGDLGAGKTTLVQGIAAALGVREHVASPTFVLVREYHGTVDVAHVDVYRLDSFQELFDLGYEELFDPGRVVLVEWGDAVAGALPDDRLEVAITRGDDDSRRIALRARGGSWQARLADAGPRLSSVAGRVVG